MISAEDGAQTVLYCVLEESIEIEAFYSQFRIYQDKAARKRGWRLKLPSPTNATLIRRPNQTLGSECKACRFVKTSRFL
jgi:hypothetical protein